MLFVVCPFLACLVLESEIGGSLERKIYGLDSSRRTENEKFGEFGSVQSGKLMFFML